VVTAAVGDDLGEDCEAGVEVGGDGVGIGREGWADQAREVGAQPGQGCEAQQAAVLVAVVIAQPGVEAVGIGGDSEVAEHGGCCRDKATGLADGVLGGPEEICSPAGVAL
jgi:hypothetical protein